MLIFLCALNFQTLMNFPSYRAGESVSDAPCEISYETPAVSAQKVQELRGTFETIRERGIFERGSLET